MADGDILRSSTGRIMRTPAGAVMVQAASAPECCPEVPPDCACCDDCPDEYGIAHSYPNVYDCFLGGFHFYQGCYGAGLYDPGTGGLLAWRSAQCDLLDSGIDGHYTLAAIDTPPFASCIWRAVVAANYRVRRYFYPFPGVRCCDPRDFVQEVFYDQLHIQLYRNRFYTSCQVWLFSTGTGITGLAAGGARDDIGITCGEVISIRLTEVVLPMCSDPTCAEGPGGGVGEQCCVSDSLDPDTYPAITAIPLVSP